MDLSRTPVRHIHGIGAKKETAYANLGIHTVRDLLYNFPRAYENRGEISLLCNARTDAKSAVVLTVATEPKSARLPHGMDLLKFKAFDESGVCEIVFFNQNYLDGSFHIGSVFRFWGKVERKGKHYTMSSPVAEPYLEDFPPPPIVSIYRMTQGLSQKQISQNILAALALASQYLYDPLPMELCLKNGLCTLSYALRQIHFPDSFQSLAIARRRLMYDELFNFSIGLSLSGRAVGGAQTEPCPDGDITPLLRLLPYKLTGAQERAIEDIRRDMASSRSMSRILIGDVGSGKTICAAAAAYIAVKNGKQAAIMAPTEILATQHYSDLSPIFSKLGISTALLTGSCTPAHKRAIYESLRTHRTDIVIGTHALLSEGVEFAHPGLIVTDEQHRFGVAQRATLSEKNRHSHMLVMTATPIPRSLALVLYGDLSISRLDELPRGRQTVDTFLVDESYRTRLEGFILKNVTEGGQVYIVCPAVEDNEIEEDEVALDDFLFEDFSLSGDNGIATPAISALKPKRPPLKAAIKYASELSDRLPDVSIAFVHGKMRARDKETIMNYFAQGELQVLVSTTVIEVGINVPNASLMIVENAERFGLSQLHQLRGRVGRGQRRSYCVLVYGGESLSQMSEAARERLQTICRSHDGFEIAETDLKLRGPGDFIAMSKNSSIRQSGEATFRIANMCEDDQLMEQAFADAKALVKSDPDLDSHPALRDAVNEMFSIKQDIIS